MHARSSLYVTRGVAHTRDTHGRSWTVRANTETLYIRTRGRIDEGSVAENYAIGNAVINCHHNTA